MAASLQIYQDMKLPGCQLKAKIVQLPTDRLLEPYMATSFIMSKDVDMQQVATVNFIFDGGVEVGSVASANISREIFESIFPEDKRPGIDKPVVVPSPTNLLHGGLPIEDPDITITTKLFSKNRLEIAIDNNNKNTFYKMTEDQGALPWGYPTITWLTVPKTPLIQGYPVEKDNSFEAKITTQSILPINLFKSDDEHSRVVCVMNNGYGGATYVPIHLIPPNNSEAISDNKVIIEDKALVDYNTTPPTYTYTFKAVSSTDSRYWDTDENRWVNRSKEDGVWQGSLLQNHVTYEFQVSLQNDVGSSDFSEAITIIPRNKPKAPQTISSKEVTPTRIENSTPGTEMEVGREGVSTILSDNVPVVSAQNLVGYDADDNKDTMNLKLSLDILDEDLDKNTQTYNKAVDPSNNDPNPDRDSNSVWMDYGPVVKDSQGNWMYEDEEGGEKMEYKTLSQRDKLIKVRYNDQGLVVSRGLFNQYEMPARWSLDPNDTTKVRDSYKLQARVTQASEGQDDGAYIETRGAWMDNEITVETPSMPVLLATSEYGAGTDDDMVDYSYTGAGVKRNTTVVDDNGDLTIKVDFHARISDLNENNGHTPTLTWTSKKGGVTKNGEVLKTEAAGPARGFIQKITEGPAYLANGNQWGQKVGLYQACIYVKFDRLLADHGLDKDSMTDDEVIEFHYEVMIHDQQETERVEDINTYFKLPENLNDDVDTYDPDSNERTIVQYKVNDAIKLKLFSKNYAKTITDNMSISLKNQGSANMPLIAMVNQQLRPTDQGTNVPRAYNYFSGYSMQDNNGILSPYEIKLNTVNIPTKGLGSGNVTDRTCVLNMKRDSVQGIHREIIYSEFSKMPPRSYPIGSVTGLSHKGLGLGGYDATVKQTLHAPKLFSHYRLLEIIQTTIITEKHSTDKKPNSDEYGKKAWWQKNPRIIRVMSRYDGINTYVTVHGDNGGCNLHPPQPDKGKIKLFGWVKRKDTPQANPLGPFADGTTEPQKIAASNAMSDNNGAEIVLKEFIIDNLESPGYGEFKKVCQIEGELLVRNDDESNDYMDIDLIVLLDVNDGSSQIAIFNALENNETWTDAPGAQSGSSSSTGGNSGDAAMGGGNSGDAAMGGGNSGDAAMGGGNSGDAAMGGGNSGDAAMGGGNSGDAAMGGGNSGDAAMGGDADGDAMGGDADGDAMGGDADGGDAPPVSETRLGMVEFKTEDNVTWSTAAPNNGTFSAAALDQMVTVPINTSNVSIKLSSWDYNATVRMGVNANAAEPVLRNTWTAVTLNGNVTVLKITVTGSDGVENRTYNLTVTKS